MTGGCLVCHCWVDIDGGRLRGQAPGKVLASTLEEWHQRCVYLLLLSCQTCRGGPIPSSLTGEVACSDAILQVV